VLTAGQTKCYSVSCPSPICRFTVSRNFNPVDVITFGCMKIKELKVGMTVYIESGSGKYDYVLKSVDILDIANGGWNDAGMKITDADYDLKLSPLWKRWFINLRHLYYSM
jgi:hypothetical protein